MPQMAPLYWEVILLFTVSICMSLISVNFFFPNNKMAFSSNGLNLKGFSKNWKW